MDTRYIVDKFEKCLTMEYYKITSIKPFRFKRYETLLRV